MGDSFLACLPEQYNAEDSAPSALPEHYNAEDSAPSALPEQNNVIRTTAYHSNTLLE